MLFFCVCKAGCAWLQETLILFGCIFKSNLSSLGHMGSTTNFPSQAWSRRIKVDRYVGRSVKATDQPNGDTRFGAWPLATMAMIMGIQAPRMRELRDATRSFQAKLKWYIPMPPDATPQHMCPETRSSCPSKKADTAFQTWKTWKTRPETCSNS